MAGRASTLLDFFRRSLPGMAAATPDGELLDRFVTTHDQAAFELLVRRHGPMVYGVARRVLRDAHASEDVLQATFLALARQASSLRRHTAVAAWLYRVAVRVACKARKPVEAKLPARPEIDAPAEAAERAELRAILDEAIDQLPEKLRRAVVLCYVAGLTTEQAAGQLGCPRGTVLSRLAAARERLRRDLTRRGVAVPASLLAAMLGSELAPAALPAGLIAVALQSAGPIAALSPTVVTLAQGVLLTMSWSKYVVATAAVLSLGVIGFGIARGPGTAPRAEQPKPADAPLAKAATGEDRADARAKAEAEIERALHTAARSRVELKLRVSASEQRVKEVEDGIKDISAISQGSAGYRLAKEVDPDFAKGVWANQEIQDATAALLVKARHELMTARRRLYEAQEELSSFEQMAALRLDVLKRQLATAGAR